MDCFRLRKTPHSEEGAQAARTKLVSSFWSQGMRKPKRERNQQDRADSSPPQASIFPHAKGDAQPRSPELYQKLQRGRIVGSLAHALGIGQPPKGMISERIYGQEGECTGYLPVPDSDQVESLFRSRNSLFDDAKFPVRSHRESRQ